MSAETIEQTAKEVAGCTKCPLSQGRCKAVPGEGSPSARIMFIGEAPGYHEDQQGRPFVGPSGQLLDQLFARIGLKREEVFITNVVKCRPPGNRDPEPAEIEACKNYLDRQIAAIDPRLIITLGRFSMARYWPGRRISEIHGQPKSENGRMFMAMFHPAAALRDRFGPNMQRFKEDGLSIPALLTRAEEIARTEIWGQPTEPKVAEKKPAYTAKKNLEESEAVVVAEGVVLPPIAPVPLTGEVIQTKPRRSRTKEKAITEPVELAEAYLNGNGAGQAIDTATVPLLESTVQSKPARRPKVKAETVPVVKEVARRKKKEPSGSAEQLSMF